MPKPIITQVLTVSQYRNTRGNQQGLMYSRMPLAGCTAPYRIPALVLDWQILDNQIQQVRDEVVDLIGKAIHHEGRGNNRLEQVTRKLAMNVLPPGGMASTMTRGVNPLFDVMNDFASRIPWEALEEHYLICPECRSIALPTKGEDPVYCEKDGCQMQEVFARLAMSYHLSYIVRGEGRAPRAAKEFLFVEDPGGDLCSEERDAEGICRDHLDKLHSIIQAKGFTLRIRARGNASRNRICSDLGNPNIAGIYYFGHGSFPQDGAEGRLELSDGPLFASEIEKIGPSARFVLLNACEGGTSGENWGIENKCNCVADAFGQGATEKVVIAPIFPVVNVQAAVTALEIFEQAENTACLGEAVHKARELSLKRYQDDGDPDISWLAYRYFGDVNRTLPSPSTYVEEIPSAGDQVRCRLFDEDNELDTDLFGFDIDEVLLRAAKRRNCQERALISLTDFVAGLVRKGELTRALLRLERIQPDVLYKTFGKTIESGRKASAEAKAKRTPDADKFSEDDREEAVAKLRELVSQWLVQEREQFDEGLLRALSRADESAQRRLAEGDGGQISEGDVLESLIADDWPAGDIPGLPSANTMGRLLKQCLREGAIDENGAVNLTFLEPGARRTIEKAHALSQQRGVCPITHRLVLAGLLADQSGYAARVFRAGGSDPETVFVLLVIISEAESEKGKSEPFALGPHACSRVITPVLQTALRIASDPHAVTEKDLFVAFCDAAHPGFKKMMRSEPFSADLDLLKSTTPPTEGLEESGKPPFPPQAATGETKSSAADSSPQTPEDTPPPGKGDLMDESNFHPRAWRIVREAAALAVRDGWPIIRTPHLFAAMIGDGQTFAASMLQASKRGLEHIKRCVLSTVPPQPQPANAPDAPGLSDNVRRTLAQAIERATSQSRSCATEEDIFTALFLDGGSIIGVVLSQLGLPVPVTAGLGAAQASPQQRPSVLSSLGRDLTALAREDKLQNVVGRDSEIETAMQALLLTENANPLLVGDAGVGKTAIVEGLAQRVAQGNCPRKLRDFRIVELSAGSLVANTRLRGDFEQRTNQVLAEARENVILFIDEIHSLVGAGLSEGGGPDASDMFKAALARGEVRLIGATTFAEYKRTIERDKAFSRRFQVQMIRAPLRETTIEILSARQKTLEEHHGVRITEESKAAAVDLSGRYIVDKQWPAKARDILERACVVAGTEGDENEPSPVLRRHVAQVVATQTNIPVEKISADEQSSLATLEQRLADRLVGQQQAVHTSAEAVRKGRRGLSGTDRPWGVLLYVGPPGVGKTELAKLLAEEVYGGSEGLIRFDMGDFTEPHSKAKLIGAPPGYVGFNQGGSLVESLRRRPYSLVLFDEIEHAHEDVLAVLLRLLSEGTIEGADSTLADARNTTIVMTSNALGSEWDGEQFGFGRAATEVSAPSQTALRERLERLLPVKLIDRIDAIVPFNCLTAEDLAKIAERQAQAIFRQTKELYGLAVETDPVVWQWLAEKAADEGDGARGVQRAVDACIAGPLGDFTASEQAQTCKKVKMVITGDTIQIHPAPGATDSGAHSQ